MRSGTIALHAGCKPDSATKAIAVPIYQTAAYASDDAADGAAISKSRIPPKPDQNPVTSVLEERVPAVKGGVD
jgi:O-acetylhomoserine (thiol)-lyase